MYHGSHFFSDLTHYVRSGDFVIALLRDSQDLNEYAFALGALAHYVADDNGHRLAVNRAVPMLYPKVAKKYGAVATYEDNPADHLKTEFGFDVLEVAKERYAPDTYHDFIGFEVSKPLLERAFEETYSIPLQSVFSDLDNVPGLLPVRRALPDPEGDENRVGVEERRYPARFAHHDGAPLSLQSFALELRKKLGPGLSAAGIRLPAAGFPSVAGAEDWPVAHTEFPRAHAASGDAFHVELQYHDRGLSGVC